MPSGDLESGTYIKLVQIFLVHNVVKSWYCSGLGIAKSGILYEFYNKLMTPDGATLVNFSKDFVNEFLQSLIIGEMRLLSAIALYFTNFFRS